MALMTHERFEALADAYGGDVSRWPPETREGAALLMSEAPDFTGSVLARAAGIDAALDAWRTAPASPRVVERIIASAPRPLAPRWRTWLSPAALGAGLAAACAAGVLVGVQAADRSGSAQEVAVTNTLSAVASAFDLEEGA
jgi:hypothetical protein